MTGKVQEIIDLISNHREALLASIAGLNEDQLNYKPAEDQWSIADLLHHLALADEANLRLSGLFIRTAREQNLPADSSPDASMLDCLDKFKGGLGGKAKAPERVTPLSYVPVEESLSRLKASRAGLLEAMDKLAAYDLSQASFPHPLLGPLNAYQWFMMAGFHEMRHTAQIDRVKAGEGFPRRD